ncbi:CAP-associated domain-containing protein [Alkalicoccus chagannorensis]|uniref:CAP-associated domain-containing protein n=1 Tax=Alkalicoccus chagannorensis TaxID=427072 RepID=UPI00040A9C31|nr:CAP-associated domain-containing protein [Alkalicoccus chagannorensis]
MARRRSRGPGFSIVLVLAAVALIWWFPFNDIEEVRDSEPAEVDDQEELVVEDAFLQDGQVYVSFRPLMNAMDASVSWEGETAWIEAERGDSSFAAQLDSTTADINGEEVSLEVAPQMVDGSVYVPIRLVTDTFGTSLVWDGDAMEAVMSEEDRQITVTAGRRDVSEPTNEQEEDNDPPEAPEEAPERWSVDGVHIGDGESDVQNAWGSPERITASQYGFDWYIYHDNYENFRMAGIADGEVAGLYTSGAPILSPEGTSLGDHRESVRGRYGEMVTEIRKGNTRYTQQQSDEFDLFEVEDGFLTTFYDVHEGDELTAAQLISEDMEMALEGYYADPDDALGDDFDRLMYDLVNADRVEHGYEPLSYNEQVASVSYNHSRDMSERGYFSHDSPEGLDPFDRMEEAGLQYSRAGENIASGQSSPIIAQQGLMNSYGHRENLLTSEYEEVGIGTAFDAENRPYYTQKFFTGR